jgi:hypothetical protein
MAGYSGTPLSRKLGIRQEFRMCVINAPGKLVIRKTSRR